VEGGVEEGGEAEDGAGEHHDDGEAEEPAAAGEDGDAGEGDGDGQEGFGEFELVVLARRRVKKGAADSRGLTPSRQLIQR
jgi:hypothetical protein